MIEAAIFDMDGLLIDSEPLWQQAEIEVFGDLGVRLTRELCRQTRGRKLVEVVDHWRERKPWNGPSTREVHDRIVERMVELVRARGEAKPGVGSALSYCAGRALRIGLASSSHYAIIEAALERLGIRERFDALHSGQEESRGKPAPDIFLNAAGKLGVTPSACLAFEDSPSGVAAAKAAGMRCVAVPDAGGVGEEGLEAERARLGAEADLLLDSLAELDDAAWRRLSI